MSIDNPLAKIIPTLTVNVLQLATLCG